MRSIHAQRNYLAQFFDACWGLPEVIQLPKVEKTLSLDEVLKL